MAVLKGWGPHSFGDDKNNTVTAEVQYGLSNRLARGVIKEMLRYRSNIRPMSGGSTLPLAFASYDLEHPAMPFGFYGGKSSPWPWQQRPDTPSSCFLSSAGVFSLSSSVRPPSTLPPPELVPAPVPARMITQHP